MKKELQRDVLSRLCIASDKDKGLGLPRKWKVIASTIILLFTMGIGQMWATDPLDTYYTFPDTKTSGQTVSPTRGENNDITVGSNGVVASAYTFAGTAYTNGLKLGNTLAKGATLTIPGSTTNPAHVFIVGSGGNKEVYLELNSTKEATGNVYTSVTTAPGVIELVVTKSGNYNLYASGDVFCYEIIILYEKNTNIVKTYLSGADMAITSSSTWDSETEELLFFKPMEVTVDKTNKRYTFGGTATAPSRRTITFTAQAKGSLSVGAMCSNNSDRNLMLKELSSGSFSEALVTSSNIKKNATTTLEYASISKGKTYVLVASGSDMHVTSIEFTASGDDCESPTIDWATEPADATEGAADATASVTTTPTPYSVSWSSNNTAVATVSDGTISYEGPGIARITASLTYAGGDYCEETVSATKDIHVWIDAITPSANDKLWYYKTAKPSSSPDNGLNYGSNKEGNGLYGVKLNSSGYAWFEKPAVAGKLRVGAYASGTDPYEVYVYACDDEGNKDGDALGTLSTPRAGASSSTIDIAADVEGIRIERKTGSEGVLYFVEFKAAPPTAYSVTYMPNGGSGAEYVVDDDATQIAENPFTAPTGKAFAGWNTSATGEGVAYAVGAAVPSDLTLYAQWANKYTVTLMPAGGTCASYEGWTYDNVNDKYTKEVGSGAEVTLPTFTKANRTFKTWRNGVPADVESPITVTADVTLTAVWNATVETVIYSWEGAEGGATEVGGTVAGSAANSINQLDAGYYCLKIDGSDYVEITLSGSEKVLAGDKISYWGFYDKNSSAHASPKMVDGNNTSTVIFADATDLPNLNGGEGTPAKRDFTAPAGINTGKVRILRNQTGSKTWIPKIQIIRDVVTEEDNVKKVTFNYNDGGATANKVVEVVSGSKVSAEAAPSYAHHRFHEWQLGGVAYDFSTAVTSNIILTADWTQLYTISFANGGGSGDAPAAIADKAQGETFTVPANTFTAPEGKEFWKWNDGMSDYLPEATYTVGTANVTLTAVWRTPAAHYAITYNKGAYGTGTIEAGDKVQDVPFTLSSDRFTRDGYVQTGWAESDGGAQAYALGGSYTANAAIELFPVWTATYTYEAPFNSGSECSATAPAGWTFANAGTYGASDATAAYICQFGNTCPAPDSIRSDDFVAFAKSNSVYATYDLGITTTVAVVNGIFNVGSGNARTFTIDYLGSDGTTVKHTVTINHPASNNWGRNTVNEKAIVDDVRYIKIKGMTSNMSWIIMQSFSVKYLETRTQYTVSFAAGDGEGTMASKSYIADAVVKAPASTFTAPTDKEFDKWAVTGVDGVTELAAGGTFTMPANAVTLTAQWRIPTVKYTVAYYDGESKLGDEEVETGASPVDYADYQTKANYVFVGWYNDPDLAEEHKVTIASEVISDNANYYGKWALDLQVTKIVFSNGFDAFINGNTVKAYYMTGESAPTMTSYEKNANVKDGGVAIVGNKVVLTGTDDSQKEYDLTLEAVTPMSSYDLQTFDGSETYVKAGLAYDGGWKFRKNASDGRISKGYTRLYFFVGGSADRATFTSCADNRKVKIYVNNVETSVTQTAPSGNTFDVPLDPAVANNMIAIVSDQTSGDGGVGAMKLNEHVISSDVTLSSLTVNGNAVDLASGSMVAGVMTFNYELPYGTVDAPTVAAVANDAFASLGAITQAASATGTATFTVTAEDGTTTQDYAVNFSIARFPTIVIWDGSTMSDIATSPISGMSWVKEGINAEENAKTCSETGKSYSYALNISGNTKDTRYLSITIPDNHVAKISLVYRANGADERSLIIATSLGSTIDETAISYVTCVNKNNDLYIMQSSYCSGTVYINTTSGFRLYEITALLYPIDYTRNVTEGRYGTICLPKAGVMVGASIFELAYYSAGENKIFMDQVVSGEMVAGRPYIFLPKEGISTLGVYYTDDDAVACGNYRGLYGYFDGTDNSMQLEPGDGHYILHNNLFREVTDSYVWIDQNRAYFKIGVEGGIPTNAVAPLPGRRRMSIGAAAPQAPTGLENGELINGENGVQKVLINGELFILRGEKMYDATGRLVK